MRQGRRIGREPRSPETRAYPVSLLWVVGTEGGVRQVPLWVIGTEGGVTQVSAGISYLRGDNMLVRIGDVRDWPFMHALGKLGIADSISPWRKQPMEETLKYRERILKGFWTWIQQSGSTAFIAEASVEECEGGPKTGKNRLIGYLVLHTSAKEELTGLSQGWIMDFAVLPEWRGKGAGRELLKAAEDHCRELGLPYLGLAVSSHNVRALHLYEQSGFAEERKLMVKRLE